LDPSEDIDSFGQSIVSHLVKRRKFEALKSVFEKGKKPNEIDLKTIEEYHHLLDFTCEYKLLEALRLCMPRFYESEDVDEKDAGGNIRLHYFSKCGFKEEVEEMIAKGAHVLAKNDKGETPWTLSLQFGHLDVVEVLVEQFFKSNSDSEGSWITEPDVDGNTVLHFAAVSGLKMRVKTLLQNGFNINAQNKAGETATHFACKHGRTPVVKELVKHPDWEERRDQNGRNAFELALEKGDKDLLLAYMSKVDSKIKKLSSVQ
jgi:ankyrin repeat protein